METISETATSPRDEKKIVSSGVVHASVSCTHVLLLKELGNPAKTRPVTWYITPAVSDKFLSNDNCINQEIMNCRYHFLVFIKEITMVIKLLKFLTWNYRTDLFRIYDAFLNHCITSY